MRRIKLLTAVFILFLIGIVLIANLGLGLVYFPFMYEIPGMDKAGHFILAGFLSFLVNILLNSASIKLFSINILKGSLIVLGVVFLEELSQIFLIYRAFSGLDLLFDLGGIFLGGWLAVRLGWNQHNRGGLKINSEND